MSGTGDDDKESQKAVPLDLARNQIATVNKTVEGKAPLVMTSQSLRGMRVLTQGVSSGSMPTTVGQTIITTNIVPQAVLKQDANRTQLGIINTQTQPQGTAANITIQRPAQITLSTTPLVATGTSYHVPRGPAVVANLAAPRSNVTTVRAPMVVTAQSGQAHAFVRPARTPSPAQTTAWLTNSSNGSQIKGAPTVLSSPVRGATVTGKPQLVSRTQSGGQSVSTIRPGTILQNAITIGQTGQIHSFKPGAAGIQALGNAVSIAQVLPRTPAVVYSTNTTPQFTAATRITVANTAPNSRQPSAGRPIGQMTATRLTVPANVNQSIGPRLVAPQATVLTTGARISAVSTPQAAVIGSSARIVANQPNVTIGRLAVGATPTQVSSTNIPGQARISALNLHSLVAVPNTSQPRTIQAQGAKVIAQPTQGTIHLTSLAAPMKTTQSVVTTTSRTISVPTAIVTQRQATVVPSQAISIAKVFPQAENQASSGPANVFIHTPNISNPPRRTSPGPTNNIQTSSNAITTTVATYSLASGTYFYDAAGNYSVARSFNQQPTPFAAISQPTQQIRPAINTQVHGIVASPQMRFNSVMVMDSTRNQQYPSQNIEQEQPQQSVPTKLTSSPRPSILRKRDHEGTPLKAAKNLAAVLTNLPPQNQPPPLSPPSRPDSRGNGHSSGGSTTISATSSPGLAEVNEDSMPLVPMNIKEEEETKPPMEMSPRKKPRKQQLTGNDLDEHNDDMQFISESGPKKEPDDSDNQSDEPRDGAPEAGQVTTVRKPASASLLNGYRHTWKATHNHYMRYSDVRPKDERRPTIMDLANQYRVQEKVNGWKVHHLSTQMEDLAEQEQAVYNQLTELLKCTESQDSSKYEDINRINELIKGNLQRIKIINDGMIEAKTQIMKIFDHKVHVTDIINRCASKRNFKKREKS